MKINITSFGYFGVYLAKELYKQNCLNSLYTNLPKRYVQDIDLTKVNSNSFSAVPYMFSKLHLYKLADLSNYPSILSFDNWVSKKLTKCDIFHSFSSFATKSHKIAKNKYNAITIVERGSSHINLQNTLLKEEYAIWNLPYIEINNNIINRELEEYTICDFITVQSSFAEDTFIKMGVSKNKIIKMPLGVNTDLFRKYKKKDDIFRVLYAGTMSIRKGSLYLLEAISKLNLPNFEFVFNGHISPELKPFISKYESKITFLGSRPFNELAELYSQASVFVLPTIEDGFAKVITEAMACGVPVIATTNCSGPDVITNAIDGFVIPIRNVDIIIEKILILYEDKYLQEQMSHNAELKAKISLSYNTYGNRVYNKYLELYNNNT
jgi:glycosyltransferase involved in cell wall biosynthesis